MKGVNEALTGNENKRCIGLFGLYVLLLIISSLMRQIEYYGSSIVILIAITIVVLVVLWKYLLHKNIISLTWTSMTYELTLYKSERMFLFSIVTLVSPILRFHDITTYDCIISGIAILVSITGYIMNERHLSAKNGQ